MHLRMLEQSDAATEIRDRLAAIGARYEIEVECCADSEGEIYAWAFFSGESAWLLAAEQAESLSGPEIEALLLSDRSSRR